MTFVLPSLRMLISVADPGPMLYKALAALESSLDLTARHP